MQLVSYNNALIAGYTTQMLESVNMVYKIALDAENAFWDTLKQQCDARIYAIVPDLVAQNILNTLPYHLNYFMERFALMINEPFEPIDFSGGTSPFYVRRGFEPEETDSLEGLISTESVQYIVEGNELPEPTSSMLPLKGYIDYVPFGEAVIQLLFGVTHTIRGWLQNHDARASSSLVYSSSIKMLYDQIYTLMSNSVSTNFAGVATPRYITQDPQFLTQDPQFLQGGFMDEDVPFYSSLGNFSLDDSYYKGSVTIYNATGFLNHMFSNNWIYVETFESLDAMGSFFDDALFKCGHAAGSTAFPIFFRPLIPDLEWLLFFQENLVGKLIKSIVTRTPGAGYIFRSIGSIDLLNKGEPGD